MKKTFIPHIIFVFLLLPLTHAQAGLLDKLVPPRILKVRLGPLKLDSAAPETWARQRETADTLVQRQVDPGIRFFNGYEPRILSAVPRNTVSSNLIVTFLGRLTLNLSGNLIDERYWLDSRTQSLTRAGGYLTADAVLSYPIKNWGASLCVNNLFNSSYSGRATDSKPPFTDRSFVLKFIRRF